MRRLQLVAVCIVLALAPAPRAGEKSHWLDGKYFFMGLGIGQDTLIYPAEGDYHGSVQFGFSARLGTVILNSLLVGYEYSYSIAIPSYGEGRHCIFSRFYPFMNKLAGYYFELGGGLLGNGVGMCEGCYIREIDVSYAFFARLGTGYDISIGDYLKLGMSFKYNINFYHKIPGHEILIVVELNLFLP